MSGRSWSRLEISIIDEKGTKAYRAVENADYQTRANAFRSLFNEKSNSKERREVLSMAIPFSILDLAPIVEGGTAAGALQNTLDFARHAERYGYHRYWLAEHHNMPGAASAATASLIAHGGGGTRSIRVGSGGIMLPNHAPLIVAEQFGTLETLYPGRIDLGLGRAPGTDRLTSRAFATGSGNQRRSICGGCARIATFLRNCGSGAGGPGDSRSGPERPTLYPGIEC